MTCATVEPHMNRPVKVGDGISRPDLGRNVRRRTAGAPITEDRCASPIASEQPSFRRQFPVPVRRGDAAIHQEVAAGDERAVGAHEQRADVSDLVRRTARPAAETSIMRR